MGKRKAFTWDTLSSITEVEGILQLGAVDFQWMNTHKCN